MGQAADRKVTEIEETRRRIESDILELEERLPVPLRSAKSVIGMLLGSAFAALLIQRFFSRKDRKRGPAAEVVIRVVREDR